MNQGLKVVWGDNMRSQNCIKITCILLSIMLISFIFAGCNTSKNNTDDVKNEDTTATATIDTEPGKFHNMPLLFAMKDDKAKIREFAMSQEQKMGSLHYKLPKNADVQISDATTVLAVSDSGTKYRLSIFDMKDEYPDDVQLFNQKQVDKIMTDFKHLYQKKRGGLKFIENIINEVRDNDNKFYMIPCQAFIPSNDYEKYTMWYIFVTYHKGKCYCIEVHENHEDYQPTPSLIETYAVLNSLKFE